MMKLRLEDRQIPLPIGKGAGSDAYQMLTKWSHLLSLEVGKRSSKGLTKYPQS